jgi:NMD protein affecting ribosome stability and mRNA decay
MPCSDRCAQIRCPDCPATASAPALVRLAPVPLYSALCRHCATWALVLASSGADKPYVYCASCNACYPAPSPSRWVAGAPAAQPAPPVQPSLF